APIDGVGVPHDLGIIRMKLGRHRFSFLGFLCPGRRWLGTTGTVVLLCQLAMSLVGSDDGDRRPTMFIRWVAWWGWTMGSVVLLCLVAAPPVGSADGDRRPTILTPVVFHPIPASSHKLAFITGWGQLQTRKK